MHGRVDAPQPKIVAGLRAVGATVQVLSNVGQGCPDILVGLRNRNYLFEIKDPDKPPSQRRLTPDQKVWHGGWAGQVNVIETLEHALVIMGLRMV